MKGVEHHKLSPWDQDINPGWAGKAGHVGRWLCALTTSP